MTKTYWFPDTSTLSNFAAVDRLDLVHRFLTDRGRWTRAVEFEVTNSAHHHPALQQVVDQQWLGEPIDPDHKEAGEIERVRIAAFGGNQREPLKHLGEAQTCHVMRTRPEFSQSTWITDDIAAFDYGQQAGILTWCTRSVVERLVGDREITAADGFAVLCRMVDADRYVHRMPQRLDELA